MLKLAQTHTLIFFTSLFSHELCGYAKDHKCFSSKPLGFAAVSVSFFTDWKFFWIENHLVCLNELQLPGLATGNSEIQCIV